MTTIYDKNPEEVIQKAAEALKKDIKMPDWAQFVKTGHAKMRTPTKEDWWFMRAASILRKVYMKGPIGTSKLRTEYTSKKNRGHKRERVYRASGKIIRVILQQLETAQYIKKDKHGTHVGRVMTPKGRSFLDKICGAKAAVKNE